MRSLSTALLALLVVAGPASASGGAVNISDGGGLITVHRDGMATVDGSGRFDRAVRPAGRFDAIALEGPTALEVVIGATPSIEVEADDNLLDRITTRIERGVLVIGTEGSFRTRRAPTVRVVLPELVRLRTRGSGDAFVRGVSGGALELVAQGSGAIVADGRATDVAADLYGSGLMDLTGLSAPRFAISLYGSGETRVHADRELSAIVYGSGLIEYSGDPAYLERRVLGSGEIRQVGR